MGMAKGNALTHVQSLWAVTAYFNWCHYRSKRENFHRFREGLLKNGVRLLTVECALYDDDFELSVLPDVIQVRSSSVMWQKERLLNIAITALPRECKFVAWIDCDLLFENADWAEEAENVLHKFGVVQLFSEMVRLPQNAMTAAQDDPISLSFMGGLCDSVSRKVPARLGHPGFAWAARRDVLEACEGFYDACIVGGADRVMAHAWFGDYQCPIVRDIALGEIWPHYLVWAKNAHRVVRGSVSLVRGRVLHLWHGESANRHYFDRHTPIAKLGFSPCEDLILNRYGCWEWSGDKPSIQEWIKAYFKGRREDG
jgi:hypothetical protein